MRLHRHDELVERMAEQVARAIYAEDVRVAEADTPAVHRPERWANPFTDAGMARQKAKLLAEGRVYATAALDALLAAVVEMGVGLGFVDVSGPSGLRFRYPTSRETPNTLILQLEENSHDE